MGMPRKRPFADIEQQYVYIWKVLEEIIYIGRGKNRRGVCTELVLKRRNLKMFDYVISIGGISKITTEVIKAINREEAKLLEKEMIIRFSPRFNIVPGSGGYSGMHTEQGLENIRKAKIGKPLPKETRRKMSEKLIGNKRRLGLLHNDETKIKISKAGIGRKLSEEAKRNISKAKIGEKNPMYGVPSPRKGVVLSEETRRKISESHLRRKR